MKVLLQTLRHKLVGFALPGDYLIVTARGQDFLICDNGDQLIV